MWERFADSVAFWVEAIYWEVACFAVAAAGRVIRFGLRFSPIWNGIAESLRATRGAR